MRNRLLIPVMAALTAVTLTQVKPDSVNKLDNVNERVRNVLNLDRTLGIAHRGFKMAAPENTLPAFELSILVEADLVELDYYHSRDGVPVVFHDRTLDHTTDAVARWGKDKVYTTSKTFEQLRELDAGVWFDPRYADLQIPTLAEAMGFIQPSAITLIERTHGDPRTLIELFEEKEMLGEVVIQAFDWEFIAGCNELRPGLALGALGPPRRAAGSAYPVEERYLDHAFLDRIEKAGARVVVWNSQITKASVAEAHRRGLRVWIYTINNLNTAAKYLAMGVDGIITDNPAMG